MESEKEELVRYELAYLLSPLISEDGLNDAVQKLRSSLERAGAVIVSESAPRRRELAYEIGTHGAAYFGWICFVGEPGAVALVGERVKEHVDVVRHFLATAPQEGAKQGTPRSFTPRETRRRDTAKEADTAEIDKKIDELIGHVSQ